MRGKYIQSRRGGQGAWEGGVWLALYHREIIYFIETKARCPHPLFGQLLGYTRLGGGGYFVDSIYSFNYPYLMWNHYPINKCSYTAE